MKIGPYTLDTSLYFFDVMLLICVFGFVIELLGFLSNHDAKTGITGLICLCLGIICGIISFRFHFIIKED